MVNPEECDDLPPGPTDPCDAGVTTRDEAIDLCYVLTDTLGKGWGNYTFLFLMLFFMVLIKWRHYNLEDVSVT